MAVCVCVCVCVSKLDGCCIGYEQQYPLLCPCKNIAVGQIKFCRLCVIIMRCFEILLAFSSFSIYIIEKGTHCIVII
jgi:hypothetical protein